LFFFHFFGAAFISFDERLPSSLMTALLPHFDTFSFAFQLLLVFRYSLSLFSFSSFRCCRYSTRHAAAFSFSRHCRSFFRHFILAAPFDAAARHAPQARYGSCSEAPPWNYVNG